jgi:beta-lactamase regulating signal transducer with metallopeptidase domain
MNTLFTYWLEVNMALAVLVSVYYVFLRKVKFLFLNRCILLLILIISCSIPFCPAITYRSDIVFQQADQLLPGNNDIGKDAAPFLPSKSGTAAGNVKSVYAVLLFVYTLISLFLFIRLLVQVVSIKRILRNSDKIQEEGLIYYRTEKHASPFSFFKYIILPKNMDAAYPQVVIHEQAHAKQWHSIDALLSEFVCVLLWVNPLAYLYRNLVKVNLEFLADDAVLCAGADAPTYQLSLLQHVLKASGNTMMSTFYSSTIRDRISMMNTERPYVHEQLRYYLMVPVIIAVYLLIDPPAAIPMEVAVAEDLSTRLPGSALNDHKEKDIKTAAVPGKEKKKRPIPKQSNAFAKAPLKQTVVEPTNSTSRLHIDARTDTVRINLRPLEEPITQQFEGLYLIGDKVYSALELRKAVEQAGQLEIILPAKPRIAYYSPGSTDAIQRWGSRAEKGIVLVEPVTIVGL